MSTIRPTSSVNWQARANTHQLGWFQIKVFKLAVGKLSSDVGELHSTVCPPDMSSSCKCEGRPKRWCNIDLLTFRWKRLVWNHPASFSISNLTDNRHDGKRRTITLMVTTEVTKKKLAPSTKSLKSGTQVYVFTLLSRSAQFGRMTKWSGEWSPFLQGNSIQYLSRKRFFLFAPRVVKTPKSTKTNPNQQQHATKISGEPARLLGYPLYRHKFMACLVHQLMNVGSIPTHVDGYCTTRTKSRPSQQRLPVAKKAKTLS